jgi:hypothetical protein
MIPNRPSPTNIDAELAAPPATKMRVASTPTRGQKGSTFWIQRGAAYPIPKPVTKGSRTRLATDLRTPTPSTTTTQFNNNLMRSGVAITPNIVVESVHTTDKATSPPASSAKRLLACPPDTLPNSFSRPERHHCEAEYSINGCCMAWEISFGVMRIAIIFRSGVP